MVKGIWEKGVHEMGGKQESADGEKQLSCHSFIKILECSIPECLLVILENLLNFDQKMWESSPVFCLLRNTGHCKLPASSRMAEGTFPAYFWALERCHYQNEEMRI